MKDLFGDLPRKPRPRKSWKQARADREAGMAHAEQGQEAWLEDAVAFAIDFVERLPDGRAFMAEDVVDAARDELASPRDARAWGPVMMRLKRAGCVTKDGYAPARTSNESPKVRWRKK